VKKEGKNQGRWFYTCQQNEPKRCDFFLWDEDAKPREAAAVLNNRRTEPVEQREDVQHGWNAGQAQQPQQQAGRGLFASMSTRSQAREDDEETLSPTPSPPQPSAVKANNGLKRTAQDAGMDEDDETFPWPLTGQEEAELADVAEVPAPETPHKALKTGVYATPATTGGKRRLPWVEQAQPTTPATSTKGAHSYFDTPSKAPITDSPTIRPTPTPNPPLTLATAKSPSPPPRFKNALTNPADSASSLTTEALATLQNVSIPPDKLSNLRSVLSKHDLKTQGISKGRDISRLALKAKDAKVAELQARIASLEAEREAERGVIRQLRWAKAHGQ